MPSIEFAGQEVRLNPQKRSAFEKITALIYEEPDDDRATELLYALNVQRLRLAGSDFDDEVVQAGLWAMHDLGVQVVEVSDGDTGVTITQREDTSVSRGDPSAYSYAAIRDGRAFAAAVANVRTRMIRFNGELRPVHRNPKEAVEQVMGLIAEVRHIGEELMMTTLRVLAALYLLNAVNELFSDVQHGYIEHFVVTDRSGAWNFCMFA